MAQSAEGEPPIGPMPKGHTLFVLPLMRLIAWVLFWLLGGIRVRGAYRVPKMGGVLIVANHISDLDPPVVQWSCPRPVHFMAKRELFAMKGVGAMLRQYRAFPVNRGEADRAAIRHAVAQLQSGECVVMFPEGELSETGEPLPLKPGFALIVRMAQCPVICCGISGANRQMPYGKVIPRPAFRAIRVEWGEPRTFQKDASSEEILEWAAAQLRSLASE